MTLFIRHGGALIAAMLLLIGAATGAAQDAGRITGIVTDAHARPLEGAQVQVVGSSLGAATNNRGQFRIENLTGPSVSIRVTSLGRAPVTRTVAVGATDIRIVLNEVALNLEAMVVTGTA